MSCYDCERLKDNVDSHIKSLQRKISELGDLSEITNENEYNIQHNYELIYELKDNIEELKQEINALKLIQILTLKRKSSPLMESEHNHLKNFVKETTKH